MLVFVLQTLPHPGAPLPWEPKNHLGPQAWPPVVVLRISLWLLFLPTLAQTPVFRWVLLVLTQLWCNHAFRYVKYLPPHGRGRGPRATGQHKKPALLLTTIRNQGRGVRNHPEGWPAPLKSSRRTLFAIELVIEPSELPEWTIEDQTIFRHRQNHFYATATSFFETQGFA